MEDKDVKKKLAKVPDVDRDGEPIWKIEDADKREEERKRSKVPLFLSETPSAAQGNYQDEKDEAPE